MVPGRPPLKMPASWLYLLKGLPLEDTKTDGGTTRAEKAFLGGHVSTLRLKASYLGCGGRGASPVRVRTGKKRATSLFSVCAKKTHKRRLKW